MISKFYIYQTPVNTWLSILIHVFYYAQKPLKHECLEARNEKKRFKKQLRIDDSEFYPSQPILSLPLLFVKTTTSSRRLNFPGSS